MADYEAVCAERDELKAKLEKLLDLYMERGKKMDRMSAEHMAELLRLKTLVEMAAKQIEKGD